MSDKVSIKTLNGYSLEDVQARQEILELSEEIGASVPVIQTATVGQTIAVKAVDENGKPIEWEAVDAANGDNSFIVNFSTEDMQTWTCDKTLDEINTAYENGQNIKGLLANGLSMPMLNKNSNGTFVFGVVFPDDTRLQSYFAMVKGDGVEMTLAYIEMKEFGT